MHPLDSNPGLIQHTGVFINNEFQSSSDGRTFDTVDPGTGRTIASVSYGSVEDVDRAVRSCHQALTQGAWSELDGKGRGAHLLALAALCESEREKLATIEALDSGKPYRMAQLADVNSAIRVLRHHASLADTRGPGGGRVLSPPTSSTPGLTLTLSAPIGVVAGILPFNFPLCGAVAKLAPALAAGCTIVLKPSEQCPLSPLYLAHLCARAGIPPGVVACVPGGRDTGAALVEHPLVAKVSFTGSNAVGQGIARVAAARCARTTLELGGKNALIVCPDFTDMGEAARIAAGANFFNAGQICVGMSRVYIPEGERYAAFVAAAVGLAEGRRVGGQFGNGGGGWDMGPLVDERQVARVLGYIERGVSEGARVACGGGRVPGTPPGSCFVQPTILTGVQDSNVCAREEIFGPVMCCIPYPWEAAEGQQKAAPWDPLGAVISRANDTPFGLAATVLTHSIPTALRCARELKVGTVWVNTHGVFDPAIPYGGLKASGWGKEYGEEGLEA
jgi:phenylacetaldehyde dehydrogenase